MLRLTRLAVLMTLAMILTTGIAAQKNSTFQRQQGDYIFGLNGGVAYQQSDVANDLNGFGLGLTYGKNLIYSPHAPFSFDVRGRFQIARSYGTDIRPTLGIERNNALNGEKTLDYTGEEEGGLVYANHKTSQVEAGLEGALTLNGLREATGLGLSFTGGVGVNWYKVMIDQRDANGLYTDQYSQVDAGGAKPYNLSQLDAFRDGKYETLADGFGRAGKFGIMPSLGIEIDYDLTNNLALGVGHRMTFSGTDLLDGQRWTDANILTGNNDILHYTSLGLKYTFNKNGTNKNHRKPTIELVEPYGSGLSTRERIVPIKATINKVDNPFDVYLTVNGKEQKFNYNNGTLAGRIRLQPGENKIIISANNQAGSTKKSFFLTYETNETSSVDDLDFGMPEIEFLNPSNNNIKVEQNELKIRARIRLVDDKDDIELKVNGKQKRFDFDKGIAALEANIDLRTGENTIEIKAKNRNGEKRMSRTIFRALPLPFPTVNFTSPAYNNAEVENSLATIKINSEHIEQSTDIQLLVNGRSEPNFYFDYERGQVKAEVKLREGRNEIEVIAINERGEARDQRTIIYKRPFVPTPTIRRPRVTINAPQYGQSTTREEVVTIHATLENIFRKSDIRLTNNGLAIYDFDFNPNTGVLRHNLYLREGINRVGIEAQNEAGREGASATINFEPRIILPPPPPPVIVVAAPSVDIFYPRRNDIFEQEEIEIKANLLGVADKRDIELIVNRNDCVDFRFNPSSGRFRATIPLEEGENTIVLKAVNPGGTDRQRVVVFHEKRYAPIIDFRTPNFTTTQKRQIKISAKVDYIENKRDIQVLLNNRTVRDFKFRNNKVEAELRLAEGNNEIEIVAENKYGKDSKRWTVDYFEPRPPSVSFSNIEENQTFRENRYKLEAIVENVESTRDIKLFVNGVLAKGVDLNNEKFTANILLKEGRNSVVLKANTEFGSDEKRLRVNYLKPKIRTIDVSPVAKVKAPIIRFLNSGKSKKQTQEMSEKIQAKIENIKSWKAIAMELNGKKFTDFDFDSKSGELTATIPLKRGTNLINISAENEGGVAEEELTITRILGRAVTAKGGKLGKSEVTKGRSKSKF